MGDYAGLLTAAAITFWVWFPLLVSLSGIIVLGIIIFVKVSKKSLDKVDFVNYEEIRESIKLEECSGESSKKKRNFLTLEDRKFLEDNLEEMSDRIGKKREYYITSFFHRKNRFNLGGAVGGIFWLGYRGMFRELFLSFILIFLCDSINFYFKLSIDMAGLPLGAVIGACGNYIYFKSLQRRVTHSKGEVKGALGIIFTFFLTIFYAYSSVIYFNEII